MAAGFHGAMAGVKVGMGGAEMLMAAGGLSMASGGVVPVVVGIGMMLGFGGLGAAIGYKGAKALLGSSEDQSTDASVNLQNPQQRKRPISYRSGMRTP